MQPELFFHYIQKLVILSADKQSVLLAQRKHEEDYNGVYSFVGGKMETTDADILAGMKREKDEEIGEAAVVMAYPTESRNLLFQKSNGHSAILAHIACVYSSGDIVLSDEYDNYKWVPLAELASFSPMIENIPEFTEWAVAKLAGIATSDLFEI